MDVKKWAIVRKDVRSVTGNRALLVTMLVIPFVFAVFLPLLFILGIAFFPDELGDFQQMLAMLSIDMEGDMSLMVLELLMNMIFPNFFVMIPVILATTSAASSFVGEKEKRTLETLLYSPMSLKDIFIAKVLASFVPAMAATFGSFVLLMAVSWVAMYASMGVFLLPGINWLLILLVVSPAVALLAITLIVGVSAKAKSVDESSQRSALLVLPVILLLIGQFSGVVLISPWLLLGIGLVVGLVAIVLLRRSLGNFTYERLLK